MQPKVVAEVDEAVAALQKLVEGDYYIDPTGLAREYGRGLTLSRLPVEPGQDYGHRMNHREEGTDLRLGMERSRHDPGWEDINAHDIDPHLMAGNVRNNRDVHSSSQLMTGHKPTPNPLAAEQHAHSQLFGPVSHSDPFHMRVAADHAEEHGFRLLPQHYRDKATRLGESVTEDVKALQKKVDEACRSTFGNMTMESGDVRSLQKVVRRCKEELDKSKLTFDKAKHRWVNPNKDKGSVSQRTAAAAKVPKGRASPEEVARVDAAIQSRPAAQELSGRFEEAMQGLPPEIKADYHHAIKTVIVRMTDKALKRTEDNLSKVHVYRNTRALNQGLYDSIPEAREVIDAGGGIMGAYHRKPGMLWGTAGELHIDGTLPGEHDTSETYAHEMGHVLDGVDMEITESDEWYEAWRDEIIGPAIETGKPPLSHYGCTSSGEGFAEMSRLIHSGNKSLKSVEKRFPKCIAVWKAHGLWPQG